MKSLKCKKRETLNSLKIISLLISLSTISLNAQSINEFTLAVSGPMAILKYDNINHKTALNDGIGLELAYGRYLSDHWSLRSGAALQTYRGNAGLDIIEGAYATQDSEAISFEFRYQFDNYREEQRAKYIQIPLLLQYEGNGFSRFFATVGVRLGFLTDSNYKTEAEELNTAGYYEQYDVLLQAPEFAGFGDFGKYAWESNDLGLQTNMILSLETGMKFLISEASSFYVSAYIDYGLTNLRYENYANKRLLDYIADEKVSIIANSILTSPIRSIDAIKTLSFGFKLKYGFGF